MNGGNATLSYDELLDFYQKHRPATTAILAEKKSSLPEHDRYIAEKDRRIAELTEHVAAQQLLIDEKQLLIEKLQKMLFGSRRERFVVPDGQTILPFIADAAVVTPEVTAEFESISYKRARAERKHAGRMPLPEHLPVEEIVHEPAEDVAELKRIGQEITDELGYEPARFFIRRHIRPKYITPEDENLNQRVVIAPLPPRPIDKCIASAELLAEMIIDKHTSHLPIYRQLQRFASLGVTIPSSTADDWMRQTALLLRPLHVLQRAIVRSVSYLQVDETPIPVLDRTQKGKTHRGYLWAYHAPLEKLLYFDYQRGRGTSNCTGILGAFTGYLQTDGYSAYNLHKARAEVVALACWAHVRRKFHQAQSNDPLRSSEALQLIRLLYDIERDARHQNLSATERKELRLEKSLPVLNALGAWLAHTRKEVTPRSAIGQATSYAINLWDELQSYLLDGSLEIDNNLVENAIRPIALGRKNYLFAGSHDGAIAIAMYQSMIGTCKLNGIDPRTWLLYVLKRIRATPQSELHTLLPQSIDRSLLA